MGGWGSGRSSYADQVTVEETRRIDIRFLKKQGYLTPGYQGSLSWSSRGQPTGSIGFRVTEERLILDYKVKAHGGDWQHITQQIELTQTPCHYGGYRQWLACPNCRRSVAVLSMAGGNRFYCRHCWKLPYSSQREDKLGRMARARDKIGERIFAGDRYSPKKGMHRRTYKRLLDRYLQLDLTVNSAIFLRFQSLEGTQRT